MYTARGSLKYRTQKFAKIRHMRTIALSPLSGYTFAMKACINNWKKPVKQ